MLGEESAESAASILHPERAQRSPVERGVACDDGLRERALEIVKAAQQRQARTALHHLLRVGIASPLGTVNVERVDGRSQHAEAPAGGTLRTVNGDVYAEVFGGSLEASTDNGVIHANLPGQGVDAASLTSQNGGVNLRMDEGASASITATALRGSVESQFSVDTADGARQPRYLKGKIGGGRARINLDTLNGNIMIARSD